MMGEGWIEVGSKIAGLLFVLTTIQQYFPQQLKHYLGKWFNIRVLGFVYPYIKLKINEHSNGRRNEVYYAIKTYLSSKSTDHARRLKADMIKNTKSIAISFEDCEEVLDEFKGIKIWYRVLQEDTNTEIQTSTFYAQRSQQVPEYKSYELIFHKRHKDVVVGAYLEHVVEQAKEIGLRNRQRKIYTNNISDYWYWADKNFWSHIGFEHPATFQTLAMDPAIKDKIISDLVTFSNGKDYYAKVGKPWKRGYLLYGPPGTGKSTMIAAIANFLKYDVYDLELTSVKNNNELRKLLIDTTSKSIIVIEDIDCSLDLTGTRKKKEEEKSKEEGENDPLKEKETDKEKEASKVTLSGLLNFIDGIWSACGSERIIVFTTNHIDKLDPALIRRGRMDMHIEMSYCKFEAFKVLAKNYLNIESHPLYETIERLLGEANISPSDVAENLMPKNASKDDAEMCLKSLIEALERAKDDARLKDQKEEPEAETEQDGDGDEDPKSKLGKLVKKHKSYLRVLRKNVWCI
ncbi:AAA-ATPase At3g28510-like [Impatiens glandulifera]|uniref:AAA-ATPase At3g28510-like n=1 Tax=Impatiens glandulifera TaxID=253017 RepID=UPI001FB0B4BF|nr:AAA-ATPase At3g28510-like [Impatiens glandulifera]